MKWWRNHLTAKLITVTLLFLTMVAVFSTWHLVVSERRLLTEQMDAQANSLLRAASIACIEPLLIEDYPVLDTLTATLVDREHVVFTTIQRADGTIVSQAPCNNTICAVREAHKTYSRRVAYGTQEPELLGTVTLGLATRHSKRLVAHRIKSIAATTLLSFIPLSLLLTWTLRKMVGNPLRSLDHQADRLGKGDLEQKIQLRSTDELGRLARTLDHMRCNLQKSYADLQAQNQQLKQLDRMKDEFLANMSHEIRTPMTAILGYADMLLESSTDPTQREALQTVRRNGKHLLTLINDILDLSKIEAGKLQVAQRYCSPHRVVTDVAALMRMRANEKHLPLKVRFLDAIPAQIQSDPTRLRQILINLIGNAIKFTDRGSVQVVCRLVTRGKDVPHMRFDVVDTGTGISDQQIDKLFQPFSQVDSSLTRSYGGTGLGLAISKRLAELLDGQLTVESQLNRGSTFTLEIPTGSLKDVPLLENLSEEVKQTASSTSDSATHDRPLRDRRILLVEDGPDNQRLLRHVLEKAGAIVTLCENGQDALEAALAAEAKEPFHLVLMDMQMPIMDGYTATTKLRQTGYPRPILALTAHAMAGDREKCIAAGCDDYLSKPIDPKRFLTAITQHIQTTRSGTTEALSPA